MSSPFPDGYRDPLQRGKHEELILHKEKENLSNLQSANLKFVICNL